jgi:hypothetical protein
MSVKELIQLKTDIQAELMARDEVKSFTVPPGTYEAGVDFPAGTYSIELKSGSDFLATIVFADTEKGLESSFNLDMIMDDSPLGKKNLSKGQFVRVSGSSLRFKTYTGIQFD